MTSANNVTSNRCARRSTRRGEARRPRERSARGRRRALGARAAARAVRLLEDVCDRSSSSHARRPSMFWGEPQPSARPSAISAKFASASPSSREQVRDRRTSASAILERHHAGPGRARDLSRATCSTFKRKRTRSASNGSSSARSARSSDGRSACRGSRPARTTCGSASPRRRVAARAVLGVAIPLIPMPIPEPEEAIELPERVVRFIELDGAAPLPPPPVVEQPKPKEPRSPSRARERATARGAAASRRLRRAAEAREPPRQRAEAAGILAFRESFATIAERSPPRSSARRLASATPARRHPVAAQRVVGHDRWRRGRAAASTRVDQPRRRRRRRRRRRPRRRRGRPRRERDRRRAGPGGAAAGRPRAAPARLAGRTDEEIQIVFDRYKASLYRLYNRELRNDPTLRGQMVLQAHDRAERQRVVPRAAVDRHECADSRRASARARAHVRLRREGRRGDHDRVPDRLLARRLSGAANGAVNVSRGGDDNIEK